MTTRRPRLIDLWMTRDELAQAIPLAYTRYIGGQLATVVGSQRPLRVGRVK